MLLLICIQRETKDFHIFVDGVTQRKIFILPFGHTRLAFDRLHYAQEVFVLIYSIFIASIYYTLYSQTKETWQR